MEAVPSWTKEYFQSNQEACLLKLKTLLPEEKAALKGNLDRSENNKIVLLKGSFSTLFVNSFLYLELILKLIFSFIFRRNDHGFARA